MGAALIVISSEFQRLFGWSPNKGIIALIRFSQNSARQLPDRWIAEKRRESNRRNPLRRKRRLAVVIGQEGYNTLRAMRRIRYKRHFTTLIFAVTAFWLVIAL